MWLTLILLISMFFGAIVGFVLGMYLTGWFLSRRPSINVPSVFNGDMHNLGQSITTSTPDTGAIIHPVPFAIKREQKLTQEAQERGEDAIEVSKL